VLVNNERIQVTIIPRDEPDITLYILALIEMARAELACEQFATDGDTAGPSEPGDAA
jgi:ATP-dependent DNA ligase